MFFNSTHYIFRHIILRNLVTAAFILCSLVDISIADRNSGLNSEPYYQIPSAVRGENLKLASQPSNPKSFLVGRTSSTGVAPAPHLISIPKIDKSDGKKFVINLNSEQQASLTLLPSLQDRTANIIKSLKAKHASIVAIEPLSGRILAISGKSDQIKEINTHSGFPAASLFKIVTAAAAYYTLETTANSVITYRGGNYTLNKYNYFPNLKNDLRKMSLGEAMGKSCNPVFGRLALSLPSSAVLKDFAMMFQFQTPIESDITIPQSEALIPSDPYELSRTGAGFGKVNISPIHAALIAATISNGGLFPTPHILDSLVLPDGQEKKLPSKKAKRVIDITVANELKNMMAFTTKNGTASNYFKTSKRNPDSKLSTIIGKTGTLRGDNPKGLTRWFIASTTEHSKPLALAIVVIDPRSGRENPTYIAREIFDHYLESN